MRLRPFFVSHVLLVAGSALAVPAFAEGPRWTPLTGFLAPEVPATPTETSSFQKPNGPKGATAASLRGVATLPLKITLGRTEADGQPHGDLGVQTLAVDGDLAEALELGNGRGALVTSAASTASGAAGLLVGDIIGTIDGRVVAGPDDLLRALKATASGQQVTVEVRRAGKGAADLKKLLVERADAGTVGAAASLGRLLSLGVVLGPRNYSEAASHYLKAAEAGHLASMTRYALFAKDGIGMRKDEALAAQWFRKGADGGQDAAMTNLGSLYETGRGVKRDYGEAARWYRAAVGKGQVSAMHRLALMYETGRGVKKDDQEAVKLLRQASNKGLSEATSWLADKYEQGRGIAKDETEAFRLNQRAADQVRRSAEQGNAVATFNLGILYRIGKGVDRSDAEAAYWVVRSLKLGDKYLVAELMRNPDVLSAADRKWMQQVLRDEGTYTGPINGTFSPAVRTAMEALASKA
ncbi:PDZ domain-containing protein [Hyphomicrobium sp. CS1GBMeth3]|uniref:PDZ domain-containing protein n=1 Tax=Hyphomicrobium sp. CS1GBMeth3 TaxID=1892845 RepID=UPI00093055A3|nr:PDZ domain-containing protein [Hyphomicrobium sp. CS1GBMeth3]